MAYDVRFKTSFNCIVNGASGSGKTTFVQNLILLKNELMDKPPRKVFFYYNILQDIYRTMANDGLVELINVAERFPTYEDIITKVHPYKDKGGCLLVFDDMMTQLTPDFEKIFCNVSHHENASVVLLTQNLFYNTKVFRTVSLNAHYIILMKSGRDLQQVSILSRAVAGAHGKHIVEAYRDATKKPYSYLILDFRPDCPPVLRARSNIFPHEYPPAVYLETSVK